MHFKLLLKGRGAPGFLREGKGVDRGERGGIGRSDPGDAHDGTGVPLTGGGRKPPRGSRARGGSM
ncbi:hypothetical protein Acid7E03_23030 [Acidisoma sp. 7E03]